jgi:1,4-dihydroxy-2-naphthoate octaprenyltransferase
MNFKIRNYVLILITLLILSCTTKTTVTYIDNVDDKKKAALVGENFYNALKNKDYKATYKLFSPKFFKVSNQENLRNSYIKISNDLGDIKNFGLTSSHTKTIKSDISTGEYTLIYNVKRTLHNTFETLTFYLEGENVRIVNYDVKYSLNKS